MPRGRPHGLPELPLAKRPRASRARGQGRAEVIYVPDTFWSRVTDWTPAGIHLREDAGKPLNRRIYEGLR